MSESLFPEEAQTAPTVSGNGKATQEKPREKSRAGTKSRNVQYPKHPVTASLRIPKAILEQNAGRDCTDTEAAAFLGVKLSGAIGVEISSARKYGFLERPEPKRVAVTELAKRILRPHSAEEAIEGFREAVRRAPVIGDVYIHYRGENIPDEQFFENALVDKFNIAREDLAEFKSVLIEDLRAAQLLEEHDGRLRVIDISHQSTEKSANDNTLKKLVRSVNVTSSDTCFVVMPFAPPLGDHYSLIYEPAVKKAGLKAVRADDDMFATGRIIDQIWMGINQAKVLVAELTGRNPNVFYELGLAHALQKPVVLVSRSEEDVPFDVRHIRVIYYDVYDPFWGEKLIAKVAENILSAIRNPEEAIFGSPSK